MAPMQSQSIPRDQFLLMSVNLLHKAFLEASRTDAKNLYKTLAQGTLVRLTNVQMEDKSTLGVNLALDHSEFRGKLNFGAFRASVGALIGKVGQTLKEEEDYPMFGGDEEGGAMIFGITGLTIEEQQPNVLVLASQTVGSDASVTLKLMYLDPSQFLEQAS